MHSPSLFVEFFNKKNLSLITGVPDSVLRNLTGALEHGIEDCAHIITANEGNAVGVVIGHFLATGQPGLVYMQNSGIGNAVNPLLSLSSTEIYGIPTFLIIGWRGKPGYSDEPQHIKQGLVTQELLHAMDVKTWVMDEHSDVQAMLEDAWSGMLRAEAPVAVLIPDNVIADYPADGPASPLNAKLNREEALKHVLEHVDEGTVLIATTGKTGRELFEIRKQSGQPTDDFLTVGGMGHASSIALGIACAQPDRRVICFDGDAALLMHMGSLGVIAKEKPLNLIHVVLNNNCHESVGGQPTAVSNIDLGLLARSCGYADYYKCITSHDIDESWKNMLAKKGPVFVEIVIKTGSRKDLGRPTETPLTNRRRVMGKLGVALR